jgi:hypothetical protein
VNCRRVLSSNPDGTCRDHQETAESLVSASGNGCRICKILVDSFTTHFQGSIPQIWKSGSLTVVRISRDENVPGVILHFMSDCFNPPAHLPSLSCEPESGTANANQSHPCLLLIESRAGLESTVAPIPDQYTGSHECISRVRTWLKDCIETHGKCNECVVKPQWYPTRLLDIGLSNDSTICLRATATAGLNGPYVALSHCWGQSRLLTLTSESMEHFRYGIGMHELPKTFWEAVYVFRRLGVQYLWIDSLCILQDCKKDWKTESAMMQKVYSQCICTIAATASMDSLAGLFRSRSPDRYWPWIEDATFGTNASTRYLIYETFLWEHQLYEQPLTRRGWVLQERLLSRRVVHFCERQIFWECYERDACEMFPHGPPPGALPEGKRIDPDVDKADELNTKIRFHEMWQRIVNRYSTCKLTEETDILVALSGVAKRIQSFVGGDYVGGMWRSHLASSLSWNAQPCGEILPHRPGEYCAPSWSWASVKSSIDFAPPSGPDSTIYIDIIDVQTRPVEDGDHFGQLAGGFLLLEGYLLSPVTVVHDHTENRGSLRIGTAMTHVGASLHIDAPIEREIAYPTDLACLAIRELWSSTESATSCLILRHVKGRSPNEYERVAHALVLDPIFFSGDRGTQLRRSSHCKIRKLAITLI